MDQQKIKKGQQVLDSDYMVMQGFDDNTDTAIVFHKIANQLDQDKRLIYKAIKNVQNMMKIEDE